MSIKSFPDYKHLLQENYVEYKYIFVPLLKLGSKILCHVFIVMLQLFVCIPRSFLLINVCNQGKTLFSPCTLVIDIKYEVWNFNSGNYLFTTDTK